MSQISRSLVLLKDCTVFLGLGKRGTTTPHKNNPIFCKKSSDSSLKALKGTLSTKRRQLHWRGLLACFSSHSFLQQNFERNTSIIQSPYKRIPAASCSPDNSSILFKLVCPGNISFLRHTANCVGLINITVSFLTCKIPVYNSVTQNTRLE